MSWQRFLTQIRYAQLRRKALLISRLRTLPLDVHETKFGNMLEGNFRSQRNRTIMKIEESIC
jgi:hypothetical protein